MRVDSNYTLRYNRILMQVNYSFFYYNTFGFDPNREQQSVSHPSSPATSSPEISASASSTKNSSPEAFSPMTTCPEIPASAVSPKSLGPEIPASASSPKNSSPEFFSPTTSCPEIATSPISPRHVIAPATSPPSKNRKYVTTLCYHSVFKKCIDKSCAFVHEPRELTEVCVSSQYKTEHCASDNCGYRFWCNYIHKDDIIERSLDGKKITVMIRHQGKLVVYRKAYIG